jgi:hypothetical protein
LQVQQPVAELKVAKLFKELLLKGYFNGAIHKGILRIRI